MVVSVAIISTVALLLVLPAEAQLALSNVGLTNSTDVVSPLYFDTNPFSNSRSASLIATFLSGLSGAPYTACHVWRSVTLLTVCRKPEVGELSLSQMPIALSITDDTTTGYYAGAGLLAPVFFLGSAAVTAVASLMFTKTRGASWRRMLIHGRYPQHLLFIFFFLYQTGVSSSTTVIALNSDLTARILYAIPIIGWIVAWLAPCAYLWRAVPQRALYVRRFRDVSDEAEIEKELHRRLVQLEKDNEQAETEATRLRLEAAHEEERLKRLEDHGAEAGSMNAEMGDAASTAGSKDGGAAFLPPPPTSPQHGGILMPDGIVRYPGELGTSINLDGSVNGNTSSSGGGRFKSVLFKSIRDLIPEGEEEMLMRHTEKYVEAALRADDAEKERLRRATNLVYSKMLASQIQAMAFDDSAVQLTLTGRDRWEDQKPLANDPDAIRMQTEAEEAEDEDVIALAKQAALSAYVPAPIADYLRAKGSVKSRTGFLLMWGGFFRHFKESAYWFAIIEFSFSLIAGVLEGWKPSDVWGSSCYVQSSILLVASGTYFAMLVVLRPYVIPLEMGLVLLSSLLQLIASCFTVVAVVSGNSWANVGANVLAVTCIYLFVLKSLLDFFLVIAPLLYSEETPWPTAKLTTYYFDTARETSDVSYYERRARLRLSHSRDRHSSSAVRRTTSKSKGDGDSTGSTSPRSPRRSRAGSFSSIQGGNASVSGTGGGGGSGTGGRGSPADGQSVVGSIPPISPTSQVRRPVAATNSPTSDTKSDGPQPLSTRVGELQVRTVDDLENEAIRYRSIGGRRNAYVGSRGVPEALHPFEMVPLPGIIPLPVRDPELLSLKQMKSRLAQERTKQSLAVAKFAELFHSDLNGGGDGSNAGGTSSEAGSSTTAASGVAVAARLGAPGLAGLAFLKEEHDKERQKEQVKSNANRLRPDQLNSLNTTAFAGGKGSGPASNGPSSRGGKLSDAGSAASARRSLADDRRSGTSWGDRSGGHRSFEEPSQETPDDPLLYEDDPDAIMDVLMFSRGAFHPHRQAVVAAAASASPTANTGHNPSGDAPATSFIQQHAVEAEQLPEHLHHSPPHMTDDKKRDLVAQRLLTMLRSSTATSRTQPQQQPSPSPQRNSPPRFRGAGVFAGELPQPTSTASPSFSPRAGSAGRSSPRRVRFLGLQEDHVEL